MLNYVQLLRSFEYLNHICIFPSSLDSHPCQLPPAGTARQIAKDTMVSEIDDFDLIERCVSRADEGAWESFVRKYSRLIWSAVHKTFRSSSFSYAREDAEDAYSGIFLSLLEDDFRRLRQFKSRNACSLSTYLTVVAVNHTIDYLRREKKHFPAMAEDAHEAHVQLADRRQNIEADLMEQELHASVNAAVDALPGQDRQVYDLLFREDRAPEAAAETLGISVPALYTRKHRLIEKIRNLLFKP